MITKQVTLSDVDHFALLFILIRERLRLQRLPKSKQDLRTLDEIAILRTTIRQLLGEINPEDIFWSPYLEKKYPESKDHFETFIAHLREELSK